MKGWVRGKNEDFLEVNPSICLCAFRLRVMTAAESLDLKTPKNPG